MRSHTKHPSNYSNGSCKSVGSIKNHNNNENICNNNTNNRHISSSNGNGNSNNNYNTSNTNNNSNGNVKVVCRIKPQLINNMGVSRNCQSINISSTNIPINNVLLPTSNTTYQTLPIIEHTSIQIGPQQLYTFDMALGPQTNQQQVYREAAYDIVEGVMQGINGTIMAYGQTSSGKTFTMEGVMEGEVENEGQDSQYLDGYLINPNNQSSLLISANSISSQPTKGVSSQPTRGVPNQLNSNNASKVNNAGIIPRMAEHLFHSIGNSKSNSQFSIKVSLVQLYMEKLRDLIDPSKLDLKLRSDRTRGVFIEDATEVYVSSAAQLTRLFLDASRRRCVKATLMNERSSRSHLILIVTVSQQDLNDCSAKSARLYLVDLAGSEKVRRTGVEGKQLDEAKKINASLSVLGKVINALTDANSSHVPYRDSKLTRLLQEALGGNSKTTLIVTCSANPNDMSQTVSSLRFGVSAKKIRNQPSINRQPTIPELKIKLERALCQIAKRDIYISRLKNQLQQMGMQPLEMVVDGQGAITQKSQSQTDLIRELERLLEIQRNLQLIRGREIGTLKDTQLKLQNQKDQLIKQVALLKEVNELKLSSIGLKQIDKTIKLVSFNNESLKYQICEKCGTKLAYQKDKSTYETKNNLENSNAVDSHKIDIFGNTKKGIFDNHSNTFTQQSPLGCSLSSTESLLLSEANLKTTTNNNNNNQPTAKNTNNNTNQQRDTKLLITNNGNQSNIKQLGSINHSKYNNPTNSNDDGNSNHIPFNRSPINSNHYEQCTKSYPLPSNITTPNLISLLNQQYTVRLQNQQKLANLSSKFISKLYHLQNSINHLTLTYNDMLGAMQRYKVDNIQLRNILQFKEQENMGLKRQVEELRDINRELEEGNYRSQGEQSQYEESSVGSEDQIYGQQEDQQYAHVGNYNKLNSLNVGNQNGVSLSGGSHNLIERQPQQPKTQNGIPHNSHNYIPHVVKIVRGGAH